MHKIHSIYKMGKGWFENLPESREQANLGKKALKVYQKDKKEKINHCKIWRIYFYFIYLLLLLLFKVKQ